MNWRLVKLTSLVIVLSLIQIGFISSMPAPFNLINLVLVVLLFLLLFDDLELLFSWLLLSGFCLALVDNLPFGFGLIALWVAVLASYFLLHHVLTNRSLYSLALLVIFANFLDQLLLRFLLWIFKLFTGEILYPIFDWQYFKNFLTGTLLNIVTMVSLFYLMHFLNPRLKPFLMLKKR
jgi:hypothetical protein